MREVGSPGLFTRGLLYCTLRGLKGRTLLISGDHYSFQVGKCSSILQGLLRVAPFVATDIL